ncbi:MAG: hypothetical protein A2X99_11070 [Deltaproteobacteria bacterium GWB2_55_19]|nr:MAG: hypothetical protein A2X99_11070 [Deltaproteobacteria bacterium GWB2_55_19]
MGMDKQKLFQAKNFIFADIEREIALADASEHFLGRFCLRRAKVHPGGANFMAALALLSYTEFAGRLKNNDFSDQNSKKNFDDFFKDLGPSYQQFLSQHNAYKIFRCGLAHEYYVKQDCIIAVRSHSQAATGIGFDGKQYFFVIEPYFQDFKNAFNVLCQTLT